MPSPSASGPHGVGVGTGVFVAVGVAVTGGVAGVVFGGGGGGSGPSWGTVRAVLRGVVKSDARFPGATMNVEVETAFNEYSVLLLAGAGFRLESRSARLSPGLGSATAVVP